MVAFHHSLYVYSWNIVHLKYVSRKMSLHKEEIEEKVCKKKKREINHHLRREGKVLYFAFMLL